MSEALLSRLGGLGGDGDISNETKQSLGLSNNATLDDVISMLALRSEDQCTIVCNLINPDNTPIVGGKIQMKDASDNILNYTTDNKGQCIFKTNSGQATISDVEFPNYFDLVKPNDVVVDSVVGTVKSVNLKREYRFTPSNNTIKITSNQNIIFSNFLNTVDCMVSGAGGGSSAINGYMNVWTYTTGSYRYKPQGRVQASGVNNYRNGGNGGINTKTINVVPNINYRCIIGRSGTSGSNSGYLWEDPIEDGGYSNRVIRLDITGSSGGSTSFNSEISATGGGGASLTSAGISYGAGARGGVSGSLSGSVAGTIYDDEWAVWNVNFRYSGSGAAGNSGYIWLNNFRYK